MKWAGLGLYWPSHKAGLSPAAWARLMFQPAENRAGLSPVARAGLMFQPKAKRGWTQPSRVGWADVPAHRRNKKTMTGYCV